MQFSVSCWRGGVAKYDLMINGVLVLNILMAMVVNIKRTFTTRTPMTGLLPQDAAAPARKRQNK